MAVPKFIGIPPGVDPYAELAVRSFLIERYNEQLKDPTVTARGKMPVLVVEPIDIVHWEIFEEFDPVQTTPEVAVVVQVMDHTQRQKGLVYRLAWREKNLSVIDTFSMLTGVRNGQMDRNFNPTNPTSVPMPLGKDPTTWPQIKLRTPHRVTLATDISSPFAKKTNELPWSSPLSAMALTCSCSAGFFCKVVREKLMEPKLPLEITDVLKRNTTSIEVALPVFGCVLHRVHIRLVEEENNWDDTVTKRFELSQLDYMHRYGVQFFEMFDGTESPNLLRIAIENIESLAKKEDAAQDKIKDTLAFINGEANIICKHTKVSRPGKPATHNFGTNRHLLAWHKEFFPDAPEFGERVMANAHCQLTYGECYWCYRNNDLALVMPTL